MQERIYPYCQAMGFQHKVLPERGCTWCVSAGQYVATALTVPLLVVVVVVMQEVAELQVVESAGASVVAAAAAVVAILITAVVMDIVVVAFLAVFAIR